MTIPHGLSAYPLTPADPAGRVDVPALRGLVRRLCTAGVDAVGLLGSTGTYAYLTRAERRRALDAALDEAGGRVPVLVGVGALRTDEAVALARDARDAGAAAGLLAPVSYTPLTEEEVYAHGVAVAAGGRLPLCLYDNPATTHFRFSPALVGRLARHPGVVGIKSPSGEAAALPGHLATLRAAVPPAFSLGTSGDWNGAAALRAGADAWHSVLAGLFPRTALALARAARNGDGAEAERRDAALRPLWALFQAHSSLRVTYACADILGLCRTPPPRPVLPLSGEARAAVETLLRSMDLD